MTLPPRIPRKAKRESRWRSQAHLTFVRSHQCCVSGCSEMPIEAAHVRLGSGAGMGQKPDDYRAVSLCREHHGWQHEVGEVSFWKEVGKDVEALIEAFCNASPKAAEIRRVRQEREVA